MTNNAPIIPPVGRTEPIRIDNLLIMHRGMNRRNSATFNTKMLIQYLNYRHDTVGGTRAG